MCFGFIKVLILHLVAGGGSDAQSLTGRSHFPGKAHAPPLHFPTRPRFDAIRLVSKKKSRNRKSKKGYMKGSTIKLTLQSIPEDEVLETALQSMPDADVLY